MIEKFSLPGVIIYLNVTLKARNSAQITFNEGEHVYVTLANGEQERVGSKKVELKKVLSNYSVTVF